MKICGNCGQPYKAHFIENEVYCYRDTNGDVFTDVPSDSLLIAWIEEKEPKLYEKLVRDWQKDNGQRLEAGNEKPKAFFELFKSQIKEFYYFRLKTKTGQPLLYSEAYTSKEAAYRGVDAVNIFGASIASYDVKYDTFFKGWRFFIKTSRDILIGSSELCGSEEKTEKQIQLVMESLPAQIKDLT